MKFGEGTGYAHVGASSALHVGVAAEKTDASKSARIRMNVRHCSRDSEIRIDKVRDGVYTPRPNLLPQETMLCADLVKKVFQSC